MIKDNLLIELGTEELPPKALKSLALSFKDAIEAEIKSAALAYESVEWFATPRRLAVRVNQVEEQQATTQVEKRGPAVQGAFDANGEPTKAALGWARGNGIDVADATRMKTDKGEWLLHVAPVDGKSLSSLVEGFINKAIKQLPIPKPMRWGSGKEEFIRPVHTLIALYGDKVLPATVLGLTASNQSQCHRFHHKGLVEVANASAYEIELEQAYVVVDYQKRQDIIVQQIEDICAKDDAVSVDDKDLLDEVTSLVEWPVALVGTFEERFLDVPPEALIYTMKDDQKYFPLLNKDNELLSKFIFITNIESKDPSQFISGNEQVVRPRLADAEFFYNTDKKKTLESRLESLESVLFQKQLGTLKDKSERISALAGVVAEQSNANKALAARAGLLSKTDLMTEVVMEFTDIQGVMGKYYALNDGEDPIVADALYQQYMPRFAGDQLPTTIEACAVAIADKFDTLVGIFGIGQHPKGDKDPFALRRAAIGIIRILIEKELDLDFKAIAKASADLFGDKLTNDNVIKDVIDFMLGRFQAYYQEQGIKVEVIRAVEVKRPTSALDFDKRIKAVVSFAELDASVALAAANKRVNNILAKNGTGDFDSVDESLLTDLAEVELVKALNAITSEVNSAYESGDYAQGLIKLSELRDAIDTFFDDVMVMAEDASVKNNRLAILAQLQSLFMFTADISVL